MDYYYLATAILVAIIYYYRKYMKIVESVKHIPGPPILPFVGNALKFIGKTPSDLVTMGEEMIEKYGHFIRILLGPKIIIVMSTPEDIESFLVDGKTMEKSEEYEYTKDWIGEGLITSTGQKWFSRRKIITPAFHFGILQSFVDTFDCNGDIFVEKLKNRQSIDIFPFVVLYALDNICESAMGTKIKAQSNLNSDYVKAVEEITKLITRRHLILPLRNDFVFKITGFQAKQKKLLKTLHGFTDSVIIARRDEIIKNINNSGTNVKSSLIDILLKSSIDGKPLSNLDIREEVDTFMFAGHDTVSSAISFTLYNIARNAEIQRKLFEELCQVFGDDKQRPHTLKDLNELRYMELVIKESLRILPPVPFIGRKLKKDTVVNGKLLPNGADVVIAPLLMGQNSSIWKDPLSFIPERFELDNMSTLSPFSFMSFSAGQRNCIGQKYAMLEMKSLVSKVLMNFEIEVEPGFKLGLKPVIVLKPTGGIKLRLKDK
ncbi:cytochrome P450 4d1-like [Bradysia coprophila]|uniref:cytochrome P450 4d1-like n=1 Tax=Bradysia coprophila TaxID=38358 RepID=UPI00187DC569|nr:cytochrome P450 4d1-like [Bradysia coprophila]